MSIASNAPPDRSDLRLQPALLKGHRLRRSLSLITVAWLFGSIWVNATSGTPYTNFAKALNATEFQFGVLAALPFLASLVSLPASLLTEATGQRKLIFLVGLYLQRTMWFPIALVPLWISRRADGQGGSAMLAFLGLVLLMHLCGAAGGPAWLSWMADIVPGRARGKYFAQRRVLGIFTALPTAVLVGWLLDRHTRGADAGTTLVWCGGVFVVAATIGLVDIALFHWVPDVPKKPQTGAHLLRAMRAPLRDRNFLWFGGYIATLTFAVSFMGQFVTLYILEILAGGTGAGGAPANMNTITQMMVIIAPALAQMIVLPVWGRAVDRMGKRPLLILAGLGLVPVAAGWCFVSREHIWLGYLLSALGAAFWAGVEVANLNLVLEMSGSGENGNGGGTGYVAVNSVVINIAGCLGGLASGVIAQTLKNADFQWVTPLKTFTYYDVLFVLSGVMRLAAIVVFVPHIHEADARPTHEALRYMSANIYNNLFNAALQPVRIIRDTVFPEERKGRERR